MTPSGSDSTPAERRAVTLREFQQRARDIFRAQPEIRSAILAIDSWVDYLGVEDVAAHIVISPRAVPRWPHECVDDVFAGDRCSGCADVPFELIHIASVGSFLPYCWPDVRQSWERVPIPYAIARRSAGGEPLIEVVGKLRRRYPEVITGAREHRPWLALPRAAALYELVAENPEVDGPRRVLADYLLEENHPRGELIALALDGRGAARRHLLMQHHGRAWISPLDIAIPVEGARWERGFLAGADVYVGNNAERLRGAAAWRTVETIRFYGRGGDLIDPAMTALRDVGTVRKGVLELAAAARPWAIERLAVALDGDGEIADALWRAHTLPRLKDLQLGGSLDTALDRPRPAWWPQLAQLTLLSRDVARHVRAYSGIAPRVAVAGVGGMGEPGWTFVMRGDRVEVSLTGWNVEAGGRALVQMLEEMPHGLAIELVPSAYCAPIDDDAMRLATATGRAVQVRP